MKTSYSIKNAITGLYSSIKRFPATIGFSSAVAVFLIIISELTGHAAGRNTLDILTRITMILALGIPLSLCIKLIFERNEKLDTLAKIAVSISVGVLLVLYYFFLLPDFKMVTAARYIAFTVALYLIFIFMPYFYKRDNFELYVIKLITRALITALYSGVLYAGLALILFTVNKLLTVYVPGKMYYYMWLVIAGVFIPSFFLGGIPLFRQQIESDDYPKLLRILLLYIVMPLAAVYMAILYIYFAKVIITFKWPVGLVANLVLWYSVTGAGIIFLISPLDGINKWARLFTFWFPKIVLPILAIMFISVGIRIKAYGITESRYFVVLLGLWVTGIMIYLNVVKRKRNIVLPISLAAIVVLSVCGPWSAYSISEYSQNKRFEKIVIKYNMVKNNTIVKSNLTVSDTDKKEISAILTYFFNIHSLKDVKYLPDNFTLDRMENVFGFSNWQSGNTNLGNVYFSYNAKIPNKPIDIKDYDFLYDFGNYQQQMSIKEGNLEVKYDFQGKKLLVINAGKTIFNASLENYVKQLHDKYKTVNTNDISREEMTFTDGNNMVKLKIVMYNIYGTEDKSTGKINIDGINFYALIKII